jgi:hypothetical protein
VRYQAALRPDIDLATRRVSLDHKSKLAFEQGERFCFNPARASQQAHLLANI